MDSYEIWVALLSLAVGLVGLLFGNGLLLGRGQVVEDKQDQQPPNPVSNSSTKLLPSGPHSSSRVGSASPSGSSPVSDTGFRDAVADITETRRVREELSKARFGDVVRDRRKAKNKS